MAEPLLSRLRFSNVERERIVALVRHHLVCYEPTWSDAAVRRWMRRVGPDLIPDLYLLNEADVRGKGVDPADDLERLEALKAHVGRIVESGAALSVRDLAISGRDLIAAGLEPGPVFGKIFVVLLDEVVEDPSKNDRDLLLARASELARLDGALPAGSE
jgi:tRNA nucleotidyltransferase (CCA-adding enzyme)